MSNPKKREKEMKKIILSLGLMLAALTLTNCSNEIDENINANTDGVAFELTAAIDGDRTATDGFKTNWVAGDQINLFHAAAGTTTYVNDNAFKVDDAAAGHFVGTLKEDLTAEAHDWYALYPFDTNYTTPNGTRYYKLWAQSQAVEANSTAHVVGKNGPLYGVATEVATGDPVKVKMHHLGTLLKVKVGNEAEDFTIESIKIEAAQSYLTGSFYVGFDSTGITKMTMSGASYANKDVTLTCDTFVEVGTDGNDLCFYAAVAPFTAPAGEKLTITVTTDKGVATIFKDVPEGTEFKAGVVNSLNVYIEEFDAVETASVATIDLTAQGWGNGVAATTTNDANNLFSASFNKGTNNNAPAFYTTGNAVRIYGGSSMTISSLGDYQLDKIVLTYGSGEGTNTITVNTGNFATNTWTATEDLTASVTFQVGGTSGNRRIAKIEIYYSPAVYPFEMSATDVKINYAAQSGTAAVSVVGSTGWDITVADDAEWLTVATALNENKQVEFSALENTTNEQRTATVTITATKGEDVQTVSLKVIQAKCLQIVSVADFNKATVDEYVIYQITGVIENISDTNFGNFYVNDGTGSTYIYGLYDADGNKVFTSLGLKDGDTITVQGARAAYNGAAQMKATYVLHVVNNESRIISVSPSTPLSFAHDATAAQNVTVTVAGNTATLGATPSASWVSATVSGNIVAISVEENTVEEARSATVTITYGEDSEVITVEQAAKPADGVVTTTIFTEDFASIKSGNSTSSSGSSSSWSKNANFSAVTNVYQAGGAVKLGTGSKTGSLTTKTLDLTGAITVTVDVKGWSSVEGKLNIKIGSVTKTITYTEKMADSFGTYSVSFDAGTGTASSSVVISTSAKRAFVDNIVITSTK